MLADVYTVLIIGLGMKNYPKLTPHLLKSIHWSTFRNFWYFLEKAQ